VRLAFFVVASGWLLMSHSLPCCPRAMTLGILLPLFYIIPREIAKLSELLSKQSKYSKRFQGSVGGHVIVCGYGLR